MTKHFKTDNVIVRRFEMKDVKQFYMNSKENENSKNNIDFPGNESIELKSIEQTKVIIKSAINEYYTDEPIWAVEDKQTRCLVGSIRVNNYSKKNKMCNISWIISAKYLDSDFMKEALGQIFNFLFLKKNIELIECSYYEQNNNSFNVLEKIGMTREATLRDRRINEKTCEKESFVIYSINKQEFYEKYGKDFLSYHHNKFLKRKI